MRFPAANGCDRSDHRAFAPNHLPVKPTFAHDFALQLPDVRLEVIHMVLHVLRRGARVFDKRRVGRALGHAVDSHTIIEPAKIDRLRLVQQRRLADHVFVDPPLSERRVPVVKCVRSARVRGAAITLLAANIIFLFACLRIRWPRTYLCWRLHLVVVELRALWRAVLGVAIPVTCRNVEGVV